MPPHQGRGRPSNRARSAERKAAVLARYQERYPDFGPTLAAEKLALDGHVLAHTAGASRKNIPVLALLLHLRRVNAAVEDVGRGMVFVLGDDDRKGFFLAGVLA